MLAENENLRQKIAAMTAEAGLPGVGALSPATNAKIRPETSPLTPEAGFSSVLDSTCDGESHTFLGVTLTPLRERKTNAALAAGEELKAEVGTEAEAEAEAGAVAEAEAEAETESFLGVKLTPMRQRKTNAALAAGEELKAEAGAEAEAKAKAEAVAGAVAEAETGGRRPHRGTRGSSGSRRGLRRPAW